VDQSTEDIAATHPAHVRGIAWFGGLRRHGRDVTKAAVRAVLVAILHVPSQDADELLATDDQQLVKTLLTDRADPALSDRVGVGRLHRCADDPGTGRAPHIIERLQNLASRSRIRNLPPDRPWRWQPRVHPYTLDGRQVDVCWEGEWIGVAECGLAHPEVLQRAGLAGWSGLALGMGLDRLLMLRKGIPDIRLLRSADPRIAGQLADLAAWRPVSAMPPVPRDLSIAVDADDTVEDLGDRVREALGVHADAVEEVSVLAETPYHRLPPQAVARLGIRPAQKNLLVRVVLRHLERTLTDQDANRLRDRIYAALHGGSAHQWTARPGQTDVADAQVDLR
jgi:phenylalanyl-tRNA synthetase alpha chain